MNIINTIIKQCYMSYKTFCLYIIVHNGSPRK